MLVLFETPAGFALFKVLDEKKLKHPEDIYKSFQDSESAKQMVKLKAFSKFDDTTEALSAANALIEGKVHKSLSKFLKKNIVSKELQDELAVIDSHLGNAIKEKLSIPCVYNEAVLELMRGLRGQLNNLMSGITDHEMNAMVLGLSHSWSRYKLKFSAEKVDTMIIQAIGLLDDLDKELNTYAMRAREWYGWHFPELSKIIPDNQVYAKTVKQMGFRTNAADMEFSSFLPEEMEADMKEAAVISMGTEISEEDVFNVRQLCDQVIAIGEYRAQLYEYLQNRMQAVAPNLACLVGELVGARLIAHAGSLMNLAKQPASTVQILGAEKALFRALKTKHETPKYGLIYHASLIGQAGPKMKGKMSRVLSAKCALSIRVDALGNQEGASVGIEHRAQVESRLRQLEGRAGAAVSGKAKGKPTPTKYDQKAAAAGATSFNAAADSTLQSEKKKKKVKEEPEAEEAPKKKKKKVEAESESEEAPKKKKKKAKAEDEEETEEPPQKKKKKERYFEEDAEEAPTTEKKKKKKKTKEESD